MTLTSLSFGIFAALTSIGALIDILKRKLPNILSLVILLCGLGFALALSGWSGLGWHAAHAAVALVIGYALFATGMFGAGDGKFYAAVAAFFPLQQAPSLALAIVLLGGILAFFWIGTKMVVPSLKIRKDDFAKLPYGLPIACGAIGLAAMQWAG